MHLQVWIVHRERSLGREFDCTINLLQPLTEQVLIVIDAAPTFTIKSVSEIELSPCIALRRIGLLPLFAGGAKLLAAKKRERGIKLFLIHLIRAGSNGCAVCHFTERTRLRRINPDNEGCVDCS